MKTQGRGHDSRRFSALTSYSGFADCKLRRPGFLVAPIGRGRRRRVSNSVRQRETRYRKDPDGFYGTCDNAFFAVLEILMPSETSALFGRLYREVQNFAAHWQKKTNLTQTLEDHVSQNGKWLCYYFMRSVYVKNSAYVPNEI